MLRGGFKCTCGQEIEVTAKLWYPEANSPQGEFGAVACSPAGEQVARKTNETETPSAWSVRQKLEELLNEEFQSFRRTIGCDEGDNYKASTSILEGIRYLREYNVNGDQD